MDYTSIFDAIPWDAVGHSVVQTFTLYWLVLLGIKLVGRRVFGEGGPQDMIILLLIAEACDLGLSDEKAGYWGTIASVLTILALGGVVERIRPLRQKLNDQALILYKNGRLQRELMKKNLVEEEDLDEAARRYGLETYKDFATIALEGDGSITGTLRSELVTRPRRT